MELSKNDVILTVREGIVRVMVENDLCLVERSELNDQSDDRSAGEVVELPILKLTDPLAEMLERVLL